MQCTYDLRSQSNKLLEYVTTYIGKCARSNTPWLSQIKNRTLTLKEPIFAKPVIGAVLKNLIFEKLRSQVYEVPMAVGVFNKGPKKALEQGCLLRNRMGPTSKMFILRIQVTQDCTLKIWASEDFQNKMYFEFLIWFYLMSYYWMPH